MTKEKFRDLTLYISKLTPYLDEKNGVTYRYLELMSVVMKKMLTGVFLFDELADAINAWCEAHAEFDKQTYYSAVKRIFDVEAHCQLPQQKIEAMSEEQVILYLYYQQKQREISQDRWYQFIQDGSALRCLRRLRELDGWSKPDSPRRLELGISQDDGSKRCFIVDLNEKCFSCLNGKADQVLGVSYERTLASHELTRVQYQLSQFPFHDWLLHYSHERETQKQNWMIRITYPQKEAATFDGKSCYPLEFPAIQALMCELDQSNSLI